MCTPNGLLVHKSREGVYSRNHIHIPPHFHTNNVLCCYLVPLVLRESVVDCLLELNLDAFTLQLLAEDPDVADDLVNGDSAASYTVFGLSDDDVDPSASTLGHVVNRIVQGKKLRHGTVLKTLAANVSIHIGKTEDKVCTHNHVST